MSPTTSHLANRSGPGTAERLAQRIIRFLALGAISLILLRVAMPLEIGADHAQQLEGAVRLASGKGLTTTAISNPEPDVMTEPAPHPLTLWPPGFSVAMALIIRWGGPLSFMLKVMYGLATASGWYAWAQICGRLFAETEIRGEPQNKLATAIATAAAGIPLLYTPRWNGTDIFLWAATPWFILLISRPSGCPHAVARALAAGLLTGFCFTFRYSAAFLCVAAGCIIVITAIRQWREALKRLLAFGAGALVFCAPIFLHMQKGLTPVSGTQAAGTTGADVIYLLKWLHVAGRQLFGNQIIELLVKRLSMDSVTIGAGVFVGCLLMIVPAALIQTRLAGLSRVTAALLISPAAVIIFICVTTRGYFIGEPRYYEATLLCWPLACCSLCWHTNALVAWSARAVVFVFLAFPLSAALESHRPKFVSAMVGYPPEALSKYTTDENRLSIFGPGMIFTHKNASKSALNRLHEHNSEAMFLIQGYPFYKWDYFPGAPASRIPMRPFPEFGELENLYSSKNGTVYIVLDTHRDSIQSHQWKSRVVYTNSQENTLIRAVNIRKGERLLDADKRAGGEE